MQAEDRQFVESLLALDTAQQTAYVAALDDDGKRMVEHLLTEYAKAHALEVADRLVTAGVPRTSADVFAKFGYEPTPKQVELHALPAWSDGGPWDLLFGGAAGGGKSFSLLFDAFARCVAFPRLQVWLIRATYPELRDSFLEKLEELNFAKVLDAKWKAQEYTLRMPNGSAMKFRHARSVADASELLSAECQMLIVDERTTIPPAVVDKLSSRIRAGGGLPVFGIRSGSNPGGVGHARVKADFIDPAPLGHERIPLVMPSGRHADRYFIPSKVVDNPHLDDGYVDRLSLLDADLRAAYRDGDWSRFLGMAFDEWDMDVHVVSPEDVEIPEGVERGLGVDYGLSAPFCALWGAKLGDGLVVIYRELYHAGWTPTQQAEAILAAEAEGERRYVTATWLDPSCWARQPNSVQKASGTNPPRGSIAADYMAAGVKVHRANNDRIGGKRLIHDGLRVRDDGRPRLLVYPTCTNLIRTLPGLPRSKLKPEDVDTKAEDHAYDGLRYLCAGLLGIPGKATVHSAASAMLPKIPTSTRGPALAAPLGRRGMGGIGGLTIGKPPSRLR